MIRMIRRRLVPGALLALGAVAVGVLGFAGPASAHVTINPREAVQGSYGRLAFRVPTESDTASTTKVEVNLPEDAPVASVSTMPVPGWTVAVERRKLATPLEVHGSQITEAVSKITWTAAVGAGVKPGEFQEFPVSMGPLPAVDTMVFKSLQTYSDGNVVRWIEEPAAQGAEEPQSPAPVLALAKAGAGAEPSAAAPVAAPAAPVGTGDNDAGGEGGDSGVAVALGAAGLVVGLAGLALGGLAFARTRKAPVAPTS
jgi:uncharacterized protein YcnI